MPGPLYHVGATALCPHMGQVMTASATPRVLVSGQPVATVADLSTVVGCAFNVSGKPQPCVKVQWLVPATRVSILGQPVLLQSSVGLCQSAEQIPAGPPSIVATQPRVVGM
jgi:hypothetical protein